MKRLTLDETWTLCLRMWRWIAGQKKEGSKKDVEDLKEQWVEDNGFENELLAHDCFFCEHVWKQTKNVPYPDETDACLLCPAKKVDKSFNCCGEKYHYYKNPLAFYAKLVELNKKRLRKKKK